MEEEYSILMQERNSSVFSFGTVINYWKQSLEKKRKQNKTNKNPNKQLQQQQKNIAGLSCPDVKPGFYR